MSIFRRKGSPYYYAEVVVRGRRVVRSTGETSRRAAEAFDRRLKDELRKQVALEAGPHTAKQAAVAYTIDQMMGRYWLEHGSKLRWCEAVARYAKRIVEHCGTIRLANFSDVDVAHLVEIVKDQGTVSTNRMLSVLQTAHSMARKRWGCQTLHIDWPMFRGKEPRARVRWITREEAALLLSNVPPHVALIIEWSLYTGLRKNETLSLTWDKVNFAKGEASVFVKGGYWREIPLSDAALSVLERAPKRATKVFDGTNLRKHFEAGLQLSKIENFRFHDLRHTYATHMRRSGAALEIVQRALGHSTIQVTQKYAHVDDSEVRAASNAIAALTPPNVVRLEATRKQFVYFITDGDMIKIGKSSDPERRLRTLQTGHPKPIWLLGTVSTLKLTEEEAHATFSDRRIRGEWFASSKRTLDGISRLCLTPSPIMLGKSSKRDGSEN